MKKNKSYSLKNVKKDNGKDISRRNGLSEENSYYERNGKFFNFPIGFPAKFYADHKESGTIGLLTINTEDELYQLAKISDRQQGSKCLTFNTPINLNENFKYGLI